MSKQINVFETLNKINLKDKIEKKNNLSYVSWAWAYTEVKKNFPNMTAKVYENEQSWNYFTDGRTCWVKVSTTIEDDEITEYLPIMDYRNNSIPLDKVTSTDVNKAIQRGLTKSLARHGLGMYVYAGEDLPEEIKKDADNSKIHTNTTLNSNQVAQIKKLIKQSGTDENKFLAYFKVDSIDKLPYDKAIQALNNKIKKAS